MSSSRVSGSVDAPAFWEELYATGGDGWDLGQPAPPLLEYLAATPPPRGRVLVPGCGRGHDARDLAGRGYDVVGVDFSPAAVAAARTLARGDGVAVSFEERDLFGLGADHVQAFDGIWEYTCFCAIDPRRRREYIDVLHTVLKPGGWLLACFYPIRSGGGGPPFPVATAEVRQLLARDFVLERAFVPITSAPQRAGQEWMTLARKRGRC